MMDFAFLILDSISASSFSRGVIKEPKYLNLVNKMDLTLVLDFVVGEPMCMVRPKHANCLFSWTGAKWSSCLFVKMEKLSSM
jgi:hypothetical protein